MIRLTITLKKMLPEIEKRYETESERDSAEVAALKKIFVTNWDYEFFKAEPTFKQVNLNLTAEFYDMYTQMMEKYLGINELQEMAIYSVVNQINHLAQYIKAGYACGTGIPGLEKIQNTPSESDLEDILEKSGLSKNNANNQKSTHDTE